MTGKLFFIFLFFVLFPTKIFSVSVLDANKNESFFLSSESKTITYSFFSSENSKFSELAFNIDSLQTNSKLLKKKRIIAALLAFPLPFGIIGLHRVYLGSEPYIPIVYIGTLGGALGILPLIDFFVLCKNKNIEKFINNKKLMMWIK